MEQSDLTDRINTKAFEGPAYSLTHRHTPTHTEDTTSWKITDIYHINIYIYIRQLHAGHHCFSSLRYPPKTPLKTGHGAPCPSFPSTESLGMPLCTRLPRPQHYKPQFLTSTHPHLLHPITKKTCLLTRSSCSKWRCHFLKTIHL